MEDTEKNKFLKDTESSGTYELIALVDLIESKTNPRKDFDPVKLKELAESIIQREDIPPLEEAEGYAALLALKDKKEKKGGKDKK
jgi:ParB-like chromosome segregation protein Spo0J